MTEPIDVDAILRDGAIDDGLTILPELLADLEADRTAHAQMLAEYLNDALARVAVGARPEVISNFNLWIAANGNGRDQQIRDIIGLPVDPVTTDEGGDIRETLIADAIRDAANTDDSRKRDELIERAVKHLARLRSPLAIERWKKELSAIGVSAETFKQLFRAALANTASDDDPIRILIARAAESDQRDVALKSLFGELAKLTAFEVVKYQAEVQERFSLPARSFERMISESRRGRGKSEIIEGRLCYQRDPLANFSARISHQLTMDDGQNNPQVRYTITAKLDDGRPLSDVEIDAEEFEKVAAWVPRNWGADAILYDAPSKAYIISRAIKELSRNDGMKRETVYTHTGWANAGGKRFYLTAGGAISAEGHDPNVRVELGHNRLAYYKLPAPPTDPAILKRAVRWSLAFLRVAPYRVTIPLWSAMYGAPLMPLMSLNAVLWPYGPTQSGKSTLTMLALSHFGEQFIKGRDYNAPKDWLSTITDLEGAMFTVKDTPLVIDDFAPQFTGVGDTREMHKRAHVVVRSVGNRSSRGRANADLSERAQRPPRGIVISTAELPLLGQSIVGRMIYIPFERGDVPFHHGADEISKLDEMQRAAGPGRGELALAMAAFIQWVAINWDRIEDETKIEHERAVQYARTVFPSTQSRLMDYYADLLTYVRVALRFARHVEAEPVNVLDELSEKIAPAALVELLSNQSARVAGQSPVVRLFESLADLILSRRAHIAPRVGSAPTPPRDSTLIGWYGADEQGKRELYIRLSQCLALARDYWQRTGEGFDTTTDALQREIFQAGLLSRRGANEYTVTVWVAEEGKTVRCLAIDQSKLSDMGVGDLWPGAPEGPEMQTP